MQRNKREKKEEREKKKVEVKRHCGEFSRECGTQKERECSE